MKRLLLRGQPWVIREQANLGERTRFRLEDLESGEQIEVLCPPDEFEPLVEPAPAFTHRAVTPFRVWHTLHGTLRQVVPRGKYAAFHAGRIAPEPYQFVPLAKLLSHPRRSLLIADDVGLGKTIEAGICLMELIARGVGKRILLVVPPGLIPQWLDEMWEKFGLEFHSIENSASQDRAQTAVSEGLQPWAYFDRVITSVEFLKRRNVQGAALAHPWDAIVVDEAHYIAESGTAANPYATARTRLGPKLREASRSLILLTATPHNGYKHSFRSLLELVEPADATLHGLTDVIQRRVARSMVRRLKSQITRTAADGSIVPAFPVREPVCRIEVRSQNDDERRVFDLVTSYCAGTIKAAADSDEADLVSFAMQIVKKRMLSSRAALHKTVSNRLQALTGRTTEEAPSRAEVRELHGDLPLAEAAAERTATRILRTAVLRDARRRTTEKRQLQEIEKLLERIADAPDPKITALIEDLERNVLSIKDEKTIIFTEYRDTLSAVRSAFAAHAILSGSIVELTGGLSPAQRNARIAQFHAAGCRILIATDAASEGLNLQRYCCRLYHMELPWNPNRLEQRNGRIDRHGQTRSPVIKYLYYADSPEDRILDRLVQRIARMHDDRVSTPDILGILEGSRIDDVLARIESSITGEAAELSLMKLFDDREKEFGDELGSFLSTGSAIDPDAQTVSVSADQSTADDLLLDRLMQDVLHGCIRAGQIGGTWRVDVPAHLRGPAVKARYECATFQRSVALQHPSGEVEFVHRLHPLFRAAAAHALSQLTLLPARHGGASRIAVRRHPMAVGNPFALFTYLDRTTHPAGTVFAIAVDNAGHILEPSITDSLLDDADGAVGEATWPECEAAFSATFTSLQSLAAKAAANRMHASVARLRTERERTGALLREDAASYCTDRLAEIDAEEQLEKAGARDQMELFRETATNWRARRAAVETNYKTRLETIERFVHVAAILEPQALGAMLVFPPK